MSRNIVQINGINMVVQIMPKFITDEKMYEVGFFEEFFPLFSFLVCLLGFGCFGGAFFYCFV